MSNEPLVSVLMTAYNREQYIAEAIESVINSTYQNWELIIVDDGSKDNTVAIAKTYADKDTRIKFYRNETNLGDYPNRNKAASYAKGVYLKYLDSDDSIYPEGLSYAVAEMMKHPNSGFGVSMIDHDYSLPSVYMESKEVLRKHFFESVHLATGPTGMIIKRELFQKVNGFDPQFKVASDSFFIIKIATLTPVVLLKQRFFNYRIHEGQEINNPTAYFIQGYRVSESIFKTLELPFSPQEKKILLNKAKKNHSRALIKNLIGRGKFKETRLIMKETNFRFRDILQHVV